MSDNQSSDRVCCHNVFFHQSYLYQTVYFRSFFGPIHVTFSLEIPRINSLSMCIIPQITHIPGCDLIKGQAIFFRKLFLDCALQDVIFVF